MSLDNDIRCYKARTSKMLVQWSSMVSEAPGILNSITESEIGVHLGSSQFRISFAWGMCWDWASLILGVSWPTQYVTLNLSPASSSQFTSLLPPPSSLLPVWLAGWLSLLRAPAYHLIDKLCDDSARAGRHHRATLHQTIRLLLKVTKC